MRILATTVSVALLSLAGASTVVAQGVYPSFDCARARTSVEHMICGNPNLARRDRAQRSWLQSRNACTSVRCVAASYDYRMKQLGGS